MNTNRHGECGDVVSSEIDPVSQSPEPDELPLPDPRETTVIPVVKPASTQSEKPQISWIPLLPNQGADAEGVQQPPNRLSFDRVEAEAPAVSAPEEAGVASGKDSEVPTRKVDVEQTGGLRESPVRDSLVVSGGTMVSRILGFVRMAVTLFVLVKVINDVFQLANTLPNQVYDLLVSSAFSAILVPAIINAQKTKNRDRFISALFVVGFGLLAVITLVATLAAPLLVRLMGWRLPPDWYWVAVGLALWCLPQIFFYGAHSLLGQYLNANGRFAAYAWSPAANNVVGIVGLLIFNWLYSKNSPAGVALQDPQNWDGAALAWLAVPATLGIVVQAVLLIPSVRRCGFRFVWPVQLRGLGLGETLREGLWATSIVAVTYLGVWATSNVAISAFAFSQENKVPVASLTEYNTANLFYALPLSVLILSVLNVLFPRVVTALLDEDFERVQRINLSFHSLVGPISIFSVVVLTTASLPLAQSLTIISSYDPELMALVLVFLAPNLIPATATIFNQRVLFAQRRTKWVLISSLPYGVIIVLGAGISLHFLPAQWWLCGVLVFSLIGQVINALLTHLSISPHLRPSLGSQLRLYIQPLLGGLLASAAGLGYLWLIGFESANYLTLVLRGLSVVVIEAAVFFVSALSSEVRSELLNLLKR